MLASIGLLVLGAALVWAGAEAAVRGATSLARAAGVPAFVLGALLFGIDLEGLGTGLAAAARGDTALAAGEIFGTVLFVFSAAFGAALVLTRTPVPSPPTSMVLAPALAIFAASATVAYDRLVSRVEGGLLVLLYACYVAYVVYEGRIVRDADEDLEDGGRPEGRGPRHGLLAVGGLLALAAGAAVLVLGAERLAGETGISSGFAGAAVLGFLVSLDEVLLEVLPIRRGAPDLATGNLFGTLAAFCTGVLGAAALVRPMVLDSAAMLALLGVAFLYAVVATPFLARGRVSWGVGLVVLTFYAAWIVGVSGI